MKKFFLSFVLLLCVIGFANNAAAQCDGQRYYSGIFLPFDSISGLDTFQVSAYDSSVVVYSNDSMTMNIYVPHADSATHRRAVLMIHGGNFYGGSSTDAFVYHMCQLYAGEGYVTASINYPLITATQLLNGVMNDSATAYPIIAQTIAEGKAAVRYLKKNAAGLGIDSTWIVIGGESSGALVADHVAYLKSDAGVSPLLDSIFNTMGGIEGNSGNPGYTSTVKAVLNYGGGMLSLDMLTPLDFEPIFTAQGDSDHNIPFSCGYLFDYYTDYSACGGGAMQPVLTSLGIVNQLLMFDSLDYEPWADSTDAITGWNHIVLPQVDTMSSIFLYQIDCPTFTSIKNINDVHVSLYPDPASTLVYIQSDADMESVELIDGLGRIVTTQPARGNLAQINVSRYSSGIYLARIMLSENKGILVRRFVVE